MIKSEQYIKLYLYLRVTAGWQDFRSSFAFSQNGIFSNYGSWTCVPASAAFQSGDIPFISNLLKTGRLVGSVMRSLAG